MLNASDSEMQLSKLLFDNMHKISVEEWVEYMLFVESDNKVNIDAEWRLEIFKQVFADVNGHQSMYPDYRLHPSPKGLPKRIEASNVIRKPGVKITTLPLKGQDRDDFIEAAKSVFEIVMSRMEPQQPEIVRKLWNPDFYIDKVLLRDDMLPIDRGYALSLIDAFLVHEVLELSIQADNLALSLN